jgi:hypothetical protein
MNVNFDSDKVYLIVSDSLYASKFIEYCLGLSCNFYLGEQLSFRHLFKNNTQSYRLNFCKSRIPPTDDQKIIRQNHYRGHAFYNDALLYWEKGQRNTKVTAEFAELSNMDIKFCIISGLVCTTVWPNCKIIRLLDTDQYFFDADLSNSEQRYNEVKGFGWPSWQDAKRNHFIASDLCDDWTSALQVKDFFQWENVTHPIFNFNMTSMHDPVQFSKQMATLYQWAGLYDYNQDLLIDYFNCFTQVVQSQKPID